MLELIKQYMSGNKWEDLCNSCYRIRYQEQGYQRVPAQHRGDGGIEGFTKTGIVYQCYCPEKHYNDNDYYCHMRDKMTKDIGKFIDIKYEKVLKDLGLKDIKEWHFVVPDYKDKRILEHAEKKRAEVIKYRTQNLEQCSFINEDFVITIKIAEDFKLEISRVIRNNLGPKLDFAVLREDKIDWSSCDSEKVNNVKRKIRAVMNEVEEDDEDYLEMIDTYMECYVVGIELMEKLRVEQVETYEQVTSLVSSYKRKVQIKSKMNTDSSLNQKIFIEILDDFQKVLEEEFPYLTKSSIEELKNDMISSWLADCSMQFKSR